MGAETILSIFALCVAIISSSVAFFTLRNERQSYSDAFRLAWTNQVIDWSDQCIETLAKMHAHLKTRHEIERTDKEENLSKISSLIDQGRLRFENQNFGKQDENIPDAYEGDVPHFIAELITAYWKYLYANSENKNEFGNDILECRRNFVSGVQNIIEPEWFHRKANKYSEDKVPNIEPESNEKC